MLFSVIIPVYNRINLLERSLDSLVHQTYTDFEVIVSDDGSTDQIEDLVLKFKNKLRIIYIKNSNYGGPSVPRNNAIKIANGEYVAFLDSDDWWTKDKLFEIFKIIQLYNSSFIYHKLFYYPSKIYKRYLYAERIKQNIISHNFKHGNPIATSSVVVKKELMISIGFFSEKLEHISIEDIIAWIDIYNIDNNFYFLNKSLGFYNNDSKSLSHSSKIKHIERENYLLNKYFKFLNKIDREFAISSFNFKKARTFHSLKKFDASYKFYLKVLLSRNISVSRFKIFLLMIFTKLKITI